jgi:hypothetical protein
MHDRRPLPLAVCAVLSAAALRGQAGAFERVGETAAPVPVLAAGEEGGTRLSIEDGRVFRIRGSARIELPATRPLGRALALARHPHGGVFVAATGGLFLTDPAHDVLDPPDLRDGVPPGEPRGIRIDAAGRIWLATDRAFGVVDAAWFFGRTFDRRHDVPPPPYSGLSIAPDGRLLLHAAGGTFAYRPDEAAPLPSHVSTTQVRGHHDGGVTYVLLSDPERDLELRFRRRHHHLLLPLRHGRIHGLKPGRHGVAVYAYDRDLRATKVAELEIEIPYPPALDRRWLPVLGAAGSVLVLALWLWRERRRGGRRRAIASAALTVVVGLQVLAALLGYGKAWPFVGFNMYTETWREQDALHRPRLFTIHADGSRHDLSFADAGLVQDGYWQVLGEIAHEDARRRDFFAGLAARRWWEPLAGFGIEDQRIRLTADGPVEVAPHVVLRWFAR